LPDTPPDSTTLAQQSELLAWANMSHRTGISSQFPSFFLTKLRV